MKRGLSGAREKPLRGAVAPLGSHGSQATSGDWADVPVRDPSPCAQVAFTDDFVRHVNESALAQEGTPLAPDLYPWYRWSETGNA